MAIVTIEEGSLCESGVINDNFEELDNNIQDLAENIEVLNSTMVSNIASINSTITTQIETLTTSIEDIFAIGEPQFSLTGTLNDGEIWLEGAEVSKDTYSNLYEIYGTNYGDAEDSDNFVLPDFRGRALWGYESEFGYIDAGLPEITGTFRAESQNSGGSCSGCFSGARQKSGVHSGTGGAYQNTYTFSAASYNDIYGNSDTVQPPAIIVRVKTRYI